METNKVEKEVKKGGIRTYLPLIIIVLVVFIAGAYWYKEYMKYISTDDAYLDADKVTVSAKILGRITKLYADEGDTVKKGMLLAELDSSELKAQEENAIASRNQAVSVEAEAQASYAHSQDELKVYEVSLQRAQEDLDRAKIQFTGGVIPKEQYEHFKKTLESAQASYESAKSGLNVSKANISHAQSVIETAKSQIELIETQLSNTRLFAPNNGVIAKRWLLPGDVAQPGQSILSITNDKKLWVAVFIEETNMDVLHLGQDVKYTIDAFPDELFHGKIYSISSNTASQFSLIPPSNASGNFTKITQRVPLKISIDATDKRKLSDYKLLAGMSAVVKIVK